MDSCISEYDFRANLSALKDRMADACDRSGRDPDSVILLPVTKTHPAEAAWLAHRAGLSAVGENRVQEAEGKIPAGPESLRWELIGHLQSNKTRQAAALFHRIQSVDSAKLLRRLNDAATELGKRLPVLLQFNTGGDPGKFGAEAAEADALLETALACPALQLDGLMTIAPLEGGREAARRAFAALRELRDRLQASGGVPLPVLSMGMSGDLEEAIAEGSTLIRVGSALYGQRA